MQPFFHIPVARSISGFGREGPGHTLKPWPQHTEAQRAERNACGQLQFASLRARSLSGSFDDFCFLLSPRAAATTTVEQSRRGKGLGGRTFCRLLGGNVPIIRRPMLHRKGEVQLDRHCASQGRSSENPNFLFWRG